MHYSIYHRPFRYPVIVDDYNVVVLMIDTYFIVNVIISQIAEKKDILPYDFRSAKIIRETSKRVIMRILQKSHIVFKG